MTRVYLSLVSRYDGRVEKLEEGLPEAVLTHCNTRVGQARQASLLGWNILLLLMEKAGKETSSLTISCNEDGKPSIPGFEFNISHSGDIVAVAISTSEVGVDIEKEEERDYDALEKRYLGPKETEIYQKSEDKAHTFLTLWTKKEAFHKHVGDGIHLDMIKRDVPYGEIYTIDVSDAEGKKYVLSVDCIDNEKVQVDVL